MAELKTGASCACAENAQAEKEGRNLQSAKQGLLFLGQPGPVVGRCAADCCLQIAPPARHPLLGWSICICNALCTCKMSHQWPSGRAPHQLPQLRGCSQQSVACYSLHMTIH